MSVFSYVSNPVFAEIGGCVAAEPVPPEIRLLLNGMVAVLLMT
ncbi:hypothetical protein [Acetobacter pomorum]|nr:hypothetical protein [Acetobacter pomorum]KGB24240.1 hypothetical protein ApDm4_1516 [Acetobacter pomorum]